MPSDLYPCRHGSLWCYCRHNTHRFGPHDVNAPHSFLMGRPKYSPRVKSGSAKVGKQK